MTADVFAQTGSIRSVIRQVRERWGGVGIEIAVKVSPKGRPDASEAALGEIRSIATSDAVGYVDKAEIRYRSIEDGRARTYDFIEEAVATSTNVDLDDNTGQPTELSVAQAIAEAYDELYDDISSALRSRS